MEFTPRSDIARGKFSAVTTFLVGFWFFFFFNNNFDLAFVHFLSFMITPN